MTSTNSSPQAESNDGRKGSKRLSRRRLLAGGAGATAAFFAAHATGDFSILREAAAKGALPAPTSAPFISLNGDFDDEPIDPAAVIDGAAGWFPSIYGEGDELGTLNEITPQKVIEALQIIKPNKNKPPKVYNMGEIMEPGMPAFPGREYVQIRQGPDSPGAPFGDNMLIGAEERIETTYQIATQIDNLNHIGVGTGTSGGDPDGVWYNGFRTGEMVEDNPHGTNFLGQHLVDPFITRGILLDVLSVKIAQGAEEALSTVEEEDTVILEDTYRITVEDLQNAMDFGGIKEIRPGDMVTIRTGWTHLFRTDAPHRARYLANEPGPYLREARWLAQFRPSVVASDTWAWEVLPTPDPTQVFPVHQVLMTQHGIRIGEAFVSEGLAEDAIYEFVFFYTGQRARWATAANVAPGAIGQSMKGPAEPGRGRGRGAR